MPDFLTVTEAAQILRIGRTAAYALAARYEHTDGAEGLPVIRIGKQLRVPRARLEHLAGGHILVTSDSPSHGRYGLGHAHADATSLPSG